MTKSVPYADVIIVGGGISGLYAARLLTDLGVDWRLLEGRNRMGGRILSVVPPRAVNPIHPTQAPSFDLGPSWFWPEYQGDLARLVEQLQLETFPQFETGEMVVERIAAPAPHRVPGYSSAPQSWRLAGGMGALVTRLQDGLKGDRMHLGQVLHRLEICREQIVLTTRNEKGETKQWQGGTILLALPPRLAAQSLDFQPVLPKYLVEDWSAVPTWMAPHAKYVAIYDKPFWREQGLSGEARSVLGPLQEIHDASAPDGPFGLFGFLGLPAQDRRSLAEPLLLEACREQLGRLFGTAATGPVTEYYKDWAADPFTATAADTHIGDGHVPAPRAAPEEGPWAGRIYAIGSEWAREFPGYVAGALESATIGVNRICLNREDRNR
ncbi:flavin monoamine oxidase family protein [Acidithiobacillus caldus]